MAAQGQSRQGRAGQTLARVRSPPKPGLEFTVLQSSTARRLLQKTAAFNHSPHRRPSCRGDAPSDCAIVGPATLPAGGIT